VGRGPRNNHLGLVTIKFFTIQYSLFTVVIPDTILRCIIFGINDTPSIGDVVKKPVPEKRKQTIINKRRLMAKISRGGSACLCGIFVHGQRRNRKTQIIETTVSRQQMV